MSLTLVIDQQLQTQEQQQQQEQAGLAEETQQSAGEADPEADPEGIYRNFSEAAEEAPTEAGSEHVFQTRMLAVSECTLNVLQELLMQSRKQTTAMEQLARAVSGSNTWQAGRASNWGAGSNSSSNQPDWLKEQFLVWQNFDERGSSPGQPSHPDWMEEVS